MKQEFDEYIDGYRTNCDRYLTLSGETSTYFAKYKARKLTEWLSNKVYSSSHILDFGCGDGAMTHFVQGEFPNAKLYGVDPSPKSIETAKSQFRDIDFSLSSEETAKLEFQDSFFDIIFSAGVFHHIPFDKHKGYVEELIRMLKPGGHLILFELNPLNPLTVLTFKRNPIDQHARMMWPIYTSNLAKQYGKTETKFYCFYPKLLSWLRPTEPYMTKVPFGALYATITEKTRD
jgi:ubiquinone/menaquinone biosynthesis C-methylase UbiE